MTMLCADDLLSSSVVANATMNRGRGFSGVNSYERELRFDISQFLAQRVQERGTALWLDVCCGEGRALVEAGTRFAETDWGASVEIIGVDLVGMFVPDKVPGVCLVAVDVMAFMLDRPADLITCVHGLHYLGDKLGFLERAMGMLSTGGIFRGHWDTQNIRTDIPGRVIWPSAVRHARQKGAALAFANHLMQIEGTDAPLDFGVQYQGATVSETPNYTGITVIDSWYRAAERKARG
jgi:SAM-dependent methyltransferase